MATNRKTYPAHRAWSAAALLLLAALALGAAACGEGGSDCSPDTCGGCCDAQGACVPGTTLTACGGGGAACATCAAGQSCAANQCLSACSPQTCPQGCCRGDLCVAGTSNDACGKGGTACTLCSGGESCSNQRCGVNSGCNETSCPSGCCEGAQCRPGTADPACGSGGALCAACPKGAACTNQQCDGGGDRCDAATCPDGCCDGITCRPGNTEAFCGAGGDVCASCPVAATCANKQCSTSTPCSAGGCTGCCAAGVCQPGTFAAACGKNGGACVTCAPGFACPAGKCVFSATGDWKVIVVSAAIRSLVNGGKDWDQGAIAGFEPPDVYIKVSAGGKSKKTKTKDNNYLPQFNETTITVKAQELAKAVQVEIWDKDLLPPDQLMGACTVTFPGFVLLKGNYTKLYCGSPEVINVQFAFAPK